MDAVIVELPKSSITWSRLSLAKILRVDYFFCVGNTFFAGWVNFLVNLVIKVQWFTLLFLVAQQLNTYFCVFVCLLCVLGF